MSVLQIWLAVNLVGLGFTGANFWDAWKNWQLVRGIANHLDPRRMVARSRLRSQSLRAATILVFVALGVGVAAELVRGLSVAWSLIFATLLITADSALDQREGSKLMDVIRAEQESEN